MTAAAFRRRLNWWPPFLFAGISVVEISEDVRTVVVALRQRWFNRTPNGLHFGGSLYAMTDPIYVLMLRRALGAGYTVLDRRAAIDFSAPGRGTVQARFHLDETILAELRAATGDGEKVLRDFTVEVRDGGGTLVATVHKTVYVRAKSAARADGVRRRRA